MIEPILDISKWQGEMDANKCINAGARGIYIRAGSMNQYTGVPYADFRFKENASKFQKRLPMGFYWYVVPGRVREQAEYFCGLISSYEFTLPPTADIEIPMSPGDVSKFVSIVEDKTGVKPVIYTRATIWNPYFGELNWASKHKLWVALYNSRIQHPWKGSYSWLKPKSWSEYWMWQYSADGNNRGREFGAESSSIDINRCNMSEEEWAKFTEQESTQPNNPDKAKELLLKLHEEIGFAAEDWRRRIDEVV